MLSLALYFRLQTICHTTMTSVSSSRSSSRLLYAVLAVCNIDIETCET